MTNELPTMVTISIGGPGGVEWKCETKPLTYDLLHDIVGICGVDPERIVAEILLKEALEKIEGARFIRCATQPT